MGNVTVHGKLTLKVGGRTYTTTNNLTNTFKTLVRDRPMSQNAILEQSVAFGNGGGLTPEDIMVGYLFSTTPTWSRTVQEDSTHFTYTSTGKRDYSVRSQMTIREAGLTGPTPGATAPLYSYLRLKSDDGADLDIKVDAGDVLRFTYTIVVKVLKTYRIQYGTSGATVEHARASKSTNSFYPYTKMLQVSGAGGTFTSTSSEGHLTPAQGNFPGGIVRIQVSQGYLQCIITLDTPIPKTDVHKMTLDVFYEVDDA